MEQPILSTAQFEHGLPILALLDLSKLFDAFFNLKAELPTVDLGGDPKAAMAAILSQPAAMRLFLPLLDTAGQAGKVQVLRKISAVLHASDAELLQAERDPAKLQELEDAAAQRPYLDCAQDLLGFFGRLGLSANVSRVSSEAGAEKSEGTETQLPALNPDASPSDGS